MALSCSFAAALAVAFLSAVAVLTPKQLAGDALRQLISLKQGRPFFDLPAHISSHPLRACICLAFSKSMSAWAPTAWASLLSTNIADTKSYSTLREHIGEAHPMEKDGSCSHPFPLPDSKKRE